MDEDRVKYLHNRFIDGTITKIEYQHWKAALDKPEGLEEISALMKSEWHAMTKGDEVPLKNNRSEEIYSFIISQTKKTSFVKNIWRYVAVAASLALIFGVTFFLTNKNTSIESASKTVINTSDILPGKNRAILTLADGRKVSLDAVQNGELARQGITSIRKTKDGRIIYTMATVDSAPTDIIYNTIEVPIGGKYEVILPDGTKVWLNASSSLRYPVRFSGNERCVSLRGEGYFEVAHRKKSSFKVESAGQTVEVLGTHFNVMAYEDEPIVKTTLLEGSVKILALGKSRQLVPGEQAEFTGHSIKVSDAGDLEEVIAWKNGYFYFNEDIRGIMNKIARWYNVEVIYQVKPEMKLAFGGKISRSRNLLALLKIMERTGKIHFKIEGRRVIVTD